MSKTVVQINSIQCVQTSEPGHDEVFMICQADGGVPVFIPPGMWRLKTNGQSMANDDVWIPLNGQEQLFQLSFEYNLVITLWDEDVDDDPTVSSYLLNYHFSPNSFNSSNTITQEFVTPGDAGFNADYIISLTKVSG